MEEIESLKIYNSSAIQKFEHDNQEFYANMSKILGITVDQMLIASVINYVVRMGLDNKYIWN